MKKKLLLLCATMVFVLALGGIASAILVSPSVNLTADETDVDHDNPGISGHYVVWDTDYYDGEDEESDVFLYDLADPLSGAVNISDNGSSYAPNIDGDRIVYTYHTEGIQLHMYTISTGNDEWLLDSDGWEQLPDISGDNVVYRSFDDSEGYDRIYYLDLADADPEPVVISDLDQACYDVAVSGGNVVFEAYSYEDDSDSDIYLKNLATPGTTVITDGNSDYEWPNIDGNTVVYEDDNNDVVYAYNIVAESTTRVSPVNEYADEPDVHGNNIVYSGSDDVSDPDEWIGFYNLVTEQTTRIMNPDGYCCPDTAAVYGNDIVYLDHWDDEDSVYHVRVTPTFDEVPGMTAPINITEGQVITTNPYIIKVFPTAGSEIVRVEFYIDGILIGTSYAPNAEGIWEFPWDTSLYHSLVTIVAYDAAGDSVTIERNTTVALELPYTGK